MLEVVPSGLVPEPRKMHRHVPPSELGPSLCCVLFHPLRVAGRCTSRARACLQGPGLRPWGCLWGWSPSVRHRHEDAFMGQASAGVGQLQPEATGHGRTAGTTEFGWLPPVHALSRCWPWRSAGVSVRSGCGRFPPGVRPSVQLTALRGRSPGRSWCELRL